MEMTTLTGSLTELDRTTVQTLRSNLQGELLQPSDPAYEKVRHIWNGMIDKRPSLIAQCENEEDVQTAVDFARENNLLLAVHGGGHGVAGHAMCDGGLVIDLTSLNDVQVNPDKNSVRVGGGATIADLDEATQEHGLAVPMGVVSKTGIAGLTLGGGIGWLRRKHGLSCDNILSMKVVTADGRLLTASADENRDLFWGLKGGGGNFGVVTEFNYRAHPVGPEVMLVFTLYHGQKIRNVLQKYRDYCATAPDEVTSLVMCGNVPPAEDFPEKIHGKPYVVIVACYAGPVEEGRRVMQPLRELGGNGSPMLDFSEPMPYLHVQTLFDEDYPDGMRYYWKSLFLDSLDDEVIDHLIAINEERPGDLSTVDIWQMGGAVARVSEAESAFGGRSAPYLLGVEANWEATEDDEANITWTRDAVTRMEQFSSGSQYLNFPGFMEGGDKTMRSTFGNKYDRLAALKQKYDPGNLFRLNQNIEPGGR